MKCLALVQHDVVGRAETGHEDSPGALAGRPFHELPRQAGDARALIDDGAALAEQRQDGRLPVPHPDAAQELDRLVDDRLLLGAAQPGCRCLHAQPSSATGTVAR